MSTATALIRILALLGLILLGVRSVAHARIQGQGASREPAAIESAREHWDKLSPERRRELVERFERWRAMSEAERTQIRDRYHWYERMRRSECDRLPDAAKQSLEGLDPERRCEAIHGLLSERISERGRAILDMLPPEWREKIERAPPEERQRLVDELKERTHPRALERLDGLAREGELTAEDATRLRALGAEELVGELVAVERRRIERRGPPSNVTAEQWETWKALPNAAFFERWNEARRRSCSSGKGRERWCHPEPPKTPREAQVRELQRSLWPESAWWIEVSKLPREERRGQISSRIRAKALDVLARSGELASPEQVEELRALEGRAFFEALEKAVPELDLPHPPSSRSREGSDRSDRSDHRYDGPKHGRTGD